MPKPFGCPLPAGKDAREGVERQHDLASTGQRHASSRHNGKKRPLGIPTMKDRAMQALYSLALDPLVETQSDPHSYGFRSQRSTQDARE
jgi:hypothetical protein